MAESRIKTLVLYAGYTGHFSYYQDWEDAFSNSRAFDAELVNICIPGIAEKTSKAIREYELIVALHSTNADSLDYIARFTRLLTGRKGLFLSFVGNEYNNPFNMTGMKEKRAFLASVQPDIIATQLPVEAGRFLYGDIAGATVISVPHALNPERFHSFIPLKERPTDIGVRTYRYSPLIGDNDRVSIVDFFRNSSFSPPLSNDISTEPGHRFPADQWPQFLNSCKGTISTEAGTGYLERDDHTVTEAADWIMSDSPPFQKFMYKMQENRQVRWLKNALIETSIRRTVKGTAVTLGLRPMTKSALIGKYNSAEFERVYDRFFRNYAAPVSGKCISSRHFDAIGTKTVQIMFPGRFNDILVPGEHYLALKRDFSNIDEVIEKFRDAGMRMKITGEAWTYVMDQHTYDHRIRQVLAALESKMEKKP